MFRATADSQAAVERFIKRAVENDAVWVLGFEGSIACCESSNHEERDVTPVFSDRAYAARGADLWGSDFASCSLDEFINEILPGQIESNCLLGPNWDSNMAGSESEPQEILDRLNAALENDP